MSASKKILVLVTNHATLGETDEANGTYSPELTHAVDVFLANGYEYDIASIKGGSAPIYGTDVEGDDVNKKILDDKDFQAKMEKTLVAADVDFSQYQAVFYPGGFGLLSDLASNEEVAKQTAAVYEAGAVVGAVCHGPAGLLPITLSNGKKLIEDIAVTGFTREEEVEFGTIEKIPFLLEESLVRTAGRYVKVAPWGEYVTAENRVVTGQNPASAHAVAEEMVKQLNS
ncbi:type 1 glutamine amidotransferase domain-containing protein [Psychrosphaera ytuae]|uniref:Type 1 glutamine amidotransferase domain-containing protein n=1 Tax=Psychrosphaera ytuae TaxID=2820710 RepID=A0A975DD18_9GAMM|nr:type 1 glutamine amidotransferase domain-containing protein [Psychrosphaera ytuae]QTH64866.1 type 1 glutamine amidotransferase domain-containing protein [Psychrosphaera ytuae]